MNTSLEKALLEKKELLKEMKNAAIVHFNEQFRLKKEEDGLAIAMQSQSPIDIDTWNIELKDIRLHTQVLETIFEEYVGLQFNLACDFIIENTSCTLIYETPFIQGNNYSDHQFTEGFTLYSYIITKVENERDSEGDDYFNISTENDFDSNLPLLVEMQKIKNEFNSLVKDGDTNTSFLHFLTDSDKDKILKEYGLTTEDQLQVVLYSILHKTDCVTRQFQTDFFDTKKLFISDFFEKHIEIDTLEKMADEVQYLEIVKDVKYCFSTQKEQYIDVLLNTPHETTFEVRLSSLSYAV